MTFMQGLKELILAGAESGPRYISPASDCPKIINSIPVEVMAEETVPSNCKIIFIPVPKQAFCEENNDYWPIDLKLFKMINLLEAEINWSLDHLRCKRGTDDAVTAIVHFIHLTLLILPLTQLFS